MIVVENISSIFVLSDCRQYSGFNHCCKELSHGGILKMKQRASLFICNATVISYIGKDYILARICTYRFFISILSVFPNLLCCKIVGYVCKCQLVQLLHKLGPTLKSQIKTVRNIVYLSKNLNIFFFLKKVLFYY